MGKWIDKKKTDDVLSEGILAIFKILDQLFGQSFNFGSGLTCVTVLLFV